MPKFTIKSRLALLIFVVLITQYSWAKKIYSFSFISIDKGLQHATVKSIESDYKGYLWVGTNNRVHRFHKKVSHGGFTGLPDDYVLFFITEDSQQNLWVGTNKGVFRLNRTLDRFEPLPAPNDRLRFKEAIDGPSGIYFLGDDSFLLYNFQHDRYMQCAYRGPATKGVSSAEWLNDSCLLIGSEWSGLQHLNIRSCAFTPVSHFPSTNVNSIQRDQQGRIWVTSYYSGIHCYDSTLNALPNSTIQDINKRLRGINDAKLINENELWVCTDGDGIGIYNIDTDQFIQHKRNESDQFSLPVNSLSTITTDQLGAIWLGTIRAGVVTMRETFARSYKTSYSTFNPQATVLSFDENQHGMWIGTDGDGLMYLDYQTDKLERIACTQDKKISSIATLSTSQLLLCIYREGFYVYDRHTQRLTPFAMPVELNNLTTNQRIETRMNSLPDDHILITKGTTCAIYNPRSAEWKVIEVPAIQNGNPMAIHLCQVHDNELHFHTNKQVFRLNKRTFKLESIYKVKQSDNIDILTAVVDRKGYVWTMSSQHLYRYNRHTEILEKFDLGMSSWNSVMVLSPTNNNVWVGTTNAVCCFNYNTHRRYLYEEIDGILPNQFITKSFIYTARNEIFMGGTTGFLRLLSNKHHNEHINQQAPILLNVLINGSRMNQNFEHLPSEINISEDNNILKVEVAVNQKSLLYNSQIFYRIKDYHHDFIPLQSQYITLEDLPVGTHTLQVIYTLQNGLESNIFDLANIQVTPIWYKTTYIRALFIILAFALIIYLIRSYNIRQRKKALKQIRTYEKQMMQQKVHFLVNINHELRTPLTLILAPIERLLSNWDTTNRDKTLDVLQRVETQARRMKHIIDMILSIRKMEYEGEIEALNYTIINLNEWLNQYVRSYRPEFEERGLQVIYNSMNEEISITTDEEKLEIILSNLLSNALKYTEKGTVQIYATIMHQSVRIHVEDEGIGIGQIDYDKLFTRYYQGADAKDGSGVGLSYCKTLLDMQGGTIGAYNNTHKAGATFYFELPNVNGNTLQLTQELQKCIDEAQTSTISESIEMLASVDLLKDKSILVVDDETELCSFIAETLASFCHKVYTAHNGVEALEQIEQHPAITLVVSDVMMPQMNGFELCKSIKTNIEIGHIGVVLLTAHVDDSNQITGYKMGADVYMPKPFDINSLLNSLIELENKRQVLTNKYKKNNFLLPIEEVTTSPADEQFLKKLQQVIIEHIDNPDLNINLLVDLMAMSRSALYSKVNTLLGKGGIRDYITRIRIDQAKNYLSSTKLNINEISDKVGFNQPKYFSTVFKEITGQTPRAYREKGE